MKTTIVGVALLVIVGIAAAPKAVACQMEQYFNPNTKKIETLYNCNGQLYDQKMNHIGTKSPNLNGIRTKTPGYDNIQKLQAQPFEQQPSPDAAQPHERQTTQRRQTAPSYMQQQGNDAALRQQAIIRMQAEKKRIDNLRLQNPCYEIDVNNPANLPPSSELDKYKFYLAKERRLERGNDVIALWNNARRNLGSFFLADVEKKLACWRKYSGRIFKKGKWVAAVNRSGSKQSSLDKDIVELK